MDPYLEQKWGEVHASLIVYTRNQLNQQLPDDLQAAIEQNASVQIDGDYSHSITPDVHVYEDGFDASEPNSDANSVAVAEPLVLPMTPQTRRHVEIRDLDGNVVTAIEILSPANKVGIKGCGQYVKKQSNYLASGTNLVEIDLLRQGSYVLAAPDESIPLEHRTPYNISVYRESEPEQAELYRVPLREQLPNIGIPLRPGERDVVLQLQPLIDDCYRDGRYHRLNYSVEPEPRFSNEDSAWANEFLSTQGFRTDD